MIVNRPVIIQSNVDFSKKSDVQGSTAIPATVNFIRTNGYTTQGDGGGALYKRAASEPSHEGKIRDSNLVWWELARQVVNPFMFGAVGDGTTDDATALANFFAYIAANDCGTADMGGNFATSTALSFGPAAGSSSTLRYAGRMKITATAAIEKIITIQGQNKAVWDGILEVNGTGSATPSTRTCTHCIYTGANNSRFRIGGMVARYAKGFGVYVFSNGTTSNQNASSFGHVTAISCGMSYASSSSPTGTSASFTARSDTGSSGSIGQRSVLTMATMPDTWIDATLNTAQHFIVYEDEIYYIAAVDRNASTISVFPWLSGSDVSGTIYYATGGGVYVMGANAGQLWFSTLDVQNSAIGVGAAATYGSDFGSAQVQSNVVGVAIGSTLSTSHVGSTFTKPYFEGNVVDAIRITRLTQPSAYATFITPTLADISKMKALPARLTGGAYSTANNSFESIVGLNLNNPGHGFEKVISNGNGGANTVTFTLDRADKSMHIRRTNGNTITVALAYDDDLHALYGYDSGHFYITGTGASGEFTGTVTFDPPSGESINAGAADATASFSSLTGPAHFLIFRNGTVWEIYKLAG